MGEDQIKTVEDKLVEFIVRVVDSKEKATDAELEALPKVADVFIEMWKYGG